MKLMRAVVLDRTCEAKDLKVTEVPVPEVKSGWVLVRVAAFGLNRSEILFRSIEADSPFISLPRIPGIECAGFIENPGDSHFVEGQKVVALMGGMGRSFDGSYAEYVLVPMKNIFPVHTELDWTNLAAVPETFFTAYGSLFDCLQLNSEDSLIIRGATSAAGIAAVQMAKSLGCTVLGSTRKAEKFSFLKSLGVDYPLLDDETISEQIKLLYKQGVTKVLDLIGPAKLSESMTWVAYHGYICSTGILAHKYGIDNFDPIKSIPNGIYLSSFFSNYPTQTSMDKIFNLISQANIVPIIAKTYSLSDIGKAHAFMEENRANGKIVVKVV